MIASSIELVGMQENYAECRGREGMRILVCVGTGCIANGSLKIYEELVRLVQETGSLVDIELLAEHESIRGNTVVQTGCRGFRAAGSLVHIKPTGVLYTHVKAEDAAEILEATMRDEVMWRLV